MKILENTIFRGKNKEIESLKTVIEQRDTFIKTLAKENNMLKTELDDTNQISADSISKLMMDNTKLRDKLAKTEKSRRKVAGKIGGFTKQMNKLVNQNIELADKYIKLKKEFNEFKEGKYIVKELKPQKVPRKRQVMNVKSGAKTSRIISKIKPNEKEEVEA